MCDFDIDHCCNILFQEAKKEENIEQEWDSERPMEAPDLVEWN